MEILDTYDEYMNYLGSDTREKVHENGSWHKTVHSWVYDNEGYIYFQERADYHKLYTTASGHVLTGETVKDALIRETKEEIGVEVNPDGARFVYIFPWFMSKIKNGKPHIDRAFSHVYLMQINAGETRFTLDPAEVSAIVKIKATDVKALIDKNVSKVTGIRITEKVENIEVSLDDLMWNLDKEVAPVVDKVLEK